MPPGVVYDGVARGGEDEDESDAREKSSDKQLFSGLKFWFSHSVPTRIWLMQNAKANGAEIVPLEKQADVLLVDHARKNQAPGTYSYQYVEMSIRKGELEDLEHHRVGAVSASSRPVGSVVTASKGTRTAYTEADDQFLWNMVKPYMDRGGLWKGNTIYQQIEQMNPRHPYQSWRDRWIKHTQYQKRDITEQFAYDQPQMQGATQPVTVPVVAHHPIPAQEGPSNTAQRTVVLPSSSAPAPARPASPVSRPDHEGPASMLGVTPSDAKPSIISPCKRRKLNETTIEVVIPVSNRSETIVVRSPPVSESDVLGDIEHASREPSPSQKPLSRAARPALVQRTSTTSFGPTVPRISDSRSLSSSGPSSTAPESFPKHYLNILFSITKEIIDRNHLQRSEGWRNLALQYGDIDRSASDWEEAWRVLVLPRWCADRDHNVQDVLRQLQDDEAEHRDASAKRQLEVEVVEADDSDTQSSGERIRCSRCMTTESMRWRLDEEGKPVCQDCRHLLRAGKMVRPSMAWTEVGDESGIRKSIEGDGQGEGPQRIVAARADIGVQTSPIASPSTPERQLHDSQFFEPESALVPRAPGANEARKRTPGRTSQSTSQDTAKSGQIDENSQNQPSVQGESQGIEILETVQERESPVVPAERSATKRRRLQDDPNTLEIPPTPEHIQTSSGAFDARGNHSARGITPVQEESESEDSESPPHASLEPKAAPEATPPVATHIASWEASQEAESEDEGSPLFVPLDKSTTRAESQPAVNLFSEGDDAPLSSSQRQPTEDDNGSEAETQSQRYAFETAPDLSHEWETAPETQAKQKAGVETQALIDDVASNLDAIDFGLPEPPGGWDLTEESYMDASEDDESDESNKEVSHADTDAPADADPTERWYQEMRSLYADTAGVNEVLLHCLKATGFDYNLSTEVLARAVQMSNTKRSRGIREKDGILLPDDIPGCFTTVDDEKLMRNDARRIAEMHTKHGIEECDRRFDILEMYAEMGI